MNISKLKRFAWAFFALALTTTTVFSQGWRNSNRGNFSQVNICTEQIADLTEDQKAKITELVNKHQRTIGDLRIKRQSTSDAIEKSEIRTEMLKKVKSHREAVKSLLTDSQQKQYDLLHLRGNCFRNQNANNRQAIGFNRGRSMNSGQLFANQGFGGCRNNSCGFRQGKSGKKTNRCQGNFQQGKGKNRNKCRFGNNFNSSKS